MGGGSSWGGYIHSFPQTPPPSRWHDHELEPAFCPISPSLSFGPVLPVESMHVVSTVLRLSLPSASLLHCHPMTPISLHQARGLATHRITAWRARCVDCAGAMLPARVSSVVTHQARRAAGLCRPRVTARDVDCAGALLPLQPTPQMSLFWPGACRRSLTRMRVPSGRSESESNSDPWHTISPGCAQYGIARALHWYHCIFFLYHFHTFPYTP